MKAYTAFGTGVKSSEESWISMATVEELIKQYETDPELQKEVNDILADGKITIREYRTFANNHDLDISLTELPHVIEEAKKMGLLK